MSKRAVTVNVNRTFLWNRGKGNSKVSITPAWSEECFR